MLELRPNCELCDKDLAPQSTQALICSYECTFCKNCVEHELKNVCPNCGGGFTARPIRPMIAHRPDLSLEHFPALQCRTKTLFSPTEIKQFVSEIYDIPPELR